MIKAFPVILLTILCLIIICGTFYILPYIPSELCLGTSCSAYPVNSGHDNYFSFLVSCFIPDEKTPVTSSVTVEDTLDTTFEVPAKTDEITVPLKDISISNETDYNINIEELMKDYTPPKKDNDNPQILIIHTHATEAFDGTTGRSLDSHKNMVEVGRVFKESLEKRGFSVIHNTTYHDYPNYNGSYVNSHQTVESILKEHPSIQIVFDLHRDGISDAKGVPLKLSTNFNEQSVAKLMFVVGTDAGGLNHPDWKQNLRFAIGLQSHLSGICDTIMRPVNLRNERFNQHLSPAYIIVECGTNGNSLEEVSRSVQILALALQNYIK